MDNKSLQANEIEALSAIYGSDWCVVDAENNVYYITLRDDGSHEKRITLEVQLPPEYPLEKQPYCTLSAPWMSRESKSLLMTELDNIYSRSKGDSIIYSWIEKCKEFLTDPNSSNDESNKDVNTNELSGEGEW